MHAGIRRRTCARRRILSINTLAARVIEHGRLWLLFSVRESRKSPPAFSVLSFPWQTNARRARWCRPEETIDRSKFIVFPLPYSRHHRDPAAPLRSGKSYIVVGTRIPVLLPDDDIRDDLIIFFFLFQKQKSVVLKHVRRRPIYRTHTVPSQFNTRHPVRAFVLTRPSPPRTPKLPVIMLSDDFPGSRAHTRTRIHHCSLNTSRVQFVSVLLCHHSEI